MEDTDSSQFYSGLIAQLYEPLAGSLADIDPIRRFVNRYGHPSLELACGAGHPMLDLIKEGLDIHGLDSSEDMLQMCRNKASVRGLQPTLFCQRMQDLNVPYRYKSCYLAGASFCLVDNLDDAQQVITAVFKHLHPGGAFLLSVFRPQLGSEPGKLKSEIRADGSTISVQALSQTEDLDNQLVRTLLQYQVTKNDVVVDSVQRTWITRWYTAAQLNDMLTAAGFVLGRVVTSNQKPVSSDATDFAVIALKLEQPYT